MAPCKGSQAVAPEYSISSERVGHAEHLSRKRLTPNPQDPASLAQESLDAGYYAATVRCEGYT